jgi:hypothetical protein
MAWEPYNRMILFLCHQNKVSLFCPMPSTFSPTLLLFFLTYLGNWRLLHILTKSVNGTEMRQWQGSMIIVKVPANRNTGTLLIRLMQWQDWPVHRAACSPHTQHIHSLHCKVCKLFKYGKVKLSLYRPWRPLGLREVEAPTFSDIQLRDGSNVVSPTRWPLFTPRKIPGTHFC